MWAQRLQQIWLTRGPGAVALLPLAGVYGWLSALNRALYRTGLRPVTHLEVPVLVVGNLVAGGGGKTPAVLALVHALQQQGIATGVISRGYGRHDRDCREVQPDDTPQAVGDEALLLRQRSGRPVCVAPRRADAARLLLLRHPDTQIIISDDGLQHHALHHDLSVCVFDERGAGNGWLLPAGPLRERGISVDWVLSSAPAGTPLPLTVRCACFTVVRHLAPQAVRADGATLPLTQCAGRPAAAVAGIARPSAFFAMLRAAGLQLTHCIALPDHYDFDSWKPSPDMPELLFCTEKDAHKLWRHAPQAWAVPLQVDMPDEFVRQVVAAVRPRLLARRSPG